MVEEQVIRLYLGKRVLFIKKDGFKISTNQDGFNIVGEEDKCVIFRDRSNRLVTISFESIVEITEIDSEVKE